MRYHALLLLIFLNHIILAQEMNRPKEGPAFFFNSFQHYSDINKDSALYFLKKLGDDKSPYSYTTLQDLLHNTFGQRFLSKWDEEIKDSAELAFMNKSRTIGYQILDEIRKDINPVLAGSAKPIWLWTQAMNQKANITALTNITTEFLALEQPVKDIYTDRLGRYGLLIWQEIQSKKELQPLANKLFSSIFTKLKTNQLIINTDTASRKLKERRTWYRYLFAYANFIKATQLQAKRNHKEAGPYFKSAFEHSPDKDDNNNPSAFFYDMHYLLQEEKRSFREDYLNFLVSSGGDINKTLAVLLDMALNNPSSKEQLRAYYEKNFTGGDSFSNYWLKNINKNLKQAPAFTLQQTDGTEFSTSAYKNKWILLDFWGTWCAPCRKEHPDLQKFYDEIKDRHTQKIIMTTIACRDTESKVSAYMKDFNYSFPVAMADIKIEKNYNISSYPSKILITPQGKFLVIPFGTDWVDFIKKYADLD